MDGAQIADAKARMRVDVRHALAGLRAVERAQGEDLVNAAVVSARAWQAAATVLAYRASGTELSVVSACNEALRAGRRLVLPRVAAPGRLALHEVRSWEVLRPGAYGIMEPPAAAPVVEAGDVDLALVPGIAFDAAGNRLGQGGGFYDRLLPAVSGSTWGVCHDVQVLESVPATAHDVPVQRVIHPAAVLSGT